MSVCVHECVRVCVCVCVSEYQEHMARRGTDPAGFNWQKRAASGGAYVE